MASDTLKPGRRTGLSAWRTAPLSGQRPRADSALGSGGRASDGHLWRVRRWPGV